MMVSESTKDRCKWEIRLEEQPHHHEHPRWDTRGTPRPFVVHWLLEVYSLSQRLCNPRGTGLLVRGCNRGRCFEFLGFTAASGGQKEHAEG